MKTTFKPILADYLVVTAIILFLACHIITTYLIWHINGVATQLGYMENMAITLEANPITKYVLNFEGFKTIYSYVLMPGLIAGLYYITRKRNNTETTTRFAITICVISFSNFLNDFTILLAILI